MSKMLQEHLRKTAAFHKEAAEQHANAGSHAHALGRLHDGELAEHFKAMGKAHEVLAREHANHSADALEMCSKATDADDLSKLRDDGIRSVIPISPISGGIPYGSAAAVTAVPRHGQPPIGGASVPAEFEFLVKTVDDE